MTKIKICGLTRVEDIKSVNRWRPDYIGFVFCQSKRQVTSEHALKIKRCLDRQISAVGVFVNEAPEVIEKLYYERIIDLVQLHGDECPEYITELKKRIPCPVIKAVRVMSKPQLLEYDNNPCDILLLDTYIKEQYGGSGKPFDYSMVPELKKEYFVAGGLNINNIERVLKKLNPAGVDISSGVEINGVKNDEKIRQIINTIRGIV